MTVVSVRSLLMIALVCFKPLLAARLNQKSEFARVSAHDQTPRPSLCCCMEGQCLMKGNSEDKVKMDVKMRGSSFCCKPRKGRAASRFKKALPAVCDKDKYTISFQGADVPMSKTLDPLTCAVVAAPAHIPVPTLEPTEAMQDAAVASKPSTGEAANLNTEDDSAAGNNDNANDKEPEMEEPVVEEPEVDESAVEEPVVEEPVVEEPAAEEPAAEEPVDEEPAVEEPVVEEPAVEELVVEEPAVEEPSVEEPGEVFEEEEPAAEETDEEDVFEEEEPEPLGDEEEADEAADKTISPSPAPTPEQTAEPTSAPTAWPTPQPTPDPDHLIDITSMFAPSHKEIKNAFSSYMCCCHSAGKVFPTISCELVDTESEPVYSMKSGCGGLKGDGYHSWNSLTQMPKYQGFVNVGMCVVPFKQLELVKRVEDVVLSGGEAAEESSKLVDVTDKFASKKVIEVGGASYMCCCKSAGAFTIACELTDTSATKIRSLKGGCGGWKGDRYHSWNTMATLRKYQAFEHAGKCVVSPAHARLLRV